jgi:hypothetical protein
MKIEEGLAPLDILLNFDRPAHGAADGGIR